MRRIKYLRLCRGLTQLELAELVGIAQPKISQLETGKNPEVSLFTLELIAGELGYKGPAMMILNKMPTTMDMAS